MQEVGLKKRALPKYKDIQIFLHEVQYKNKASIYFFLLADNGCVSYAEFSSVWTAIYHDSLDVATKFVTNMDMDHDGCLDDIEVLVNGVRNNQHLKIGSYMTSHPNAFLLV